VFETRSLALGVHERFGEGDPDESFNDRRFGFGRAEGRPARFGDEARSLPNGFGRRALCDERDEGDRKVLGVSRSIVWKCFASGARDSPDRLAGKVRNVRWSRFDVTQVANVVLELSPSGERNSVVWLPGLLGGCGVSNR
jgi:predicted DNA-binding transcriptional regulator AlpA